MSMGTGKPSPDCSGVLRSRLSDDRHKALPCLFYHRSDGVVASLAGRSRGKSLAQRLAESVCPLRRATSFDLTVVIRRLARCLCALLVVLGFLGPVAHAQSGVDLRAVDFARQKEIALDQGWALYSGKLLSPQEVARGSDEPDLLGTHLPLLSNQLQIGQTALRDLRRLTLALTVNMPPAGGRYALRLGDIGAAYRLWLNGQLLVTQGELSELAQNERPRLGVRLTEFENDGSPVELVLEVSNHLYAERWLLEAPVIGLADEVLAAQNRQWGGAHFFAGCLLMMGCYHLLFFSFRRQNRGPLYFGLYCLLWVLSFSASTSSHWFVLLYAPEFPVALLHRLEVMSFVASVPVGFMFFQSLFPKEFSSRLMRACQAVGGLFFLGAAILPVPWVLLVQHLYYLVSIPLIFYVLQRLLLARRCGREGAAFILWGFALLGGIAINDMLCDLGLIRSVYLIHIGLFFFVLAQGLALALQFSRAFASVERLSDDLENRNTALEDEIVERTRLEREIANVSEKERRFLSHSLHDGLCQYLTAARLRCAVLEQKHGNETGGRELTALAQLLQQTVDQAYALARGLWPVEHDRQRMAAFLADYCRQLSEVHDVCIDVVCASDNQCADNERIVQIYRIAQEAIANAAKHARARRIEVSIDYQSAEKMLVMTVVDDGVGMQAGAPRDGGLGMRMMAHRARMIGADLQIGHNHPSGTLVRCALRCAACQ